MLLRKIGKALANPRKAWHFLSKEISHELSVVPYSTRGTCRIVVGGKTVVFSTRDWYSKEWFFPRMDNGRYHEPAVTAIVEILAPSTPSFIDVGAHLGYFTCVAAALMPGKPVLAYEIDDRSFERLARNVALNCEENVHLFHTAIAEATGTARYHRPLRIDSGEALVPGTTPGGTDVAAITLDDSLRENQVTAGIVKIDVEGAEYGVLYGAREMLTKGTVLLLEIHGQKLAKFDADSKKVLELLEREGYDTYEITGHRHAATPTLKLLTSEEPPLTYNSMTLVVRKNDAHTRSLLTAAFGDAVFHG